MGIEVPEPIVTDQALALNFTNEGGVENTFRFLKNIMGLWLVQECPPDMGTSRRQDVLYSDNRTCREGKAFWRTH